MKISLSKKKKRWNNSHLTQLSRHNPLCPYTAASDERWELRPVRDASRFVAALARRLPRSWLPVKRRLAALWSGSRSAERNGISIQQIDLLQLKIHLIKIQFDNQ